jgi:hypothetical protein
MLKVVQVAPIAVAAMVGLLVVAVAIIAAVHGRTLDPTDSVNYPHCSVAAAGQACQSP